MTEHDMWIGPGPIADALGVDPKTATRLIDAKAFGVGNDRKTPKGHRRVRFTAVQAYIASKQVAAANREAADSVRGAA